MYKFQYGLRARLVEDGIVFYNVWLNKFNKIKVKNLETVYTTFIKYMGKNFFSEDEILQEFIESGIGFKNATKIIMLLKKNSYIIKQSEDFDNNRYSRQIRFFENYESSTISAKDYNSNLQEKKVMIIGLGGYGTFTLMLCARLGIKNIVIVDFDIVELTNLNRQTFYDTADIGRKKVDVCKEKVKEIDSDINVTAYDMKINSVNEMCKLLEGVDLVFNAFGYIPDCIMYAQESNIIIEACDKLSISCLTYNGSFIGPVSKNKENFVKFINSPLILNSLVESLPINNSKYGAAIIPRISICCSIAVWEAVRFLSGVGSMIDEETIIVVDTVNYLKHRIIKLGEDI